MQTLLEGVTQEVLKIIITVNKIHEIRQQVYMHISHTVFSSLL